VNTNANPDDPSKWQLVGIAMAIVLMLAVVGGTLLVVW
jgi:hypothetical protein